PTENVVETDTNSPTIIGVNGKLSLSNLVGNNTIRVYDAIGRMIVSKETSNTSMEMQVPIPGMYTIQIISGTKSWTKKVIL
ncbi:MAG: T9SS type A sorting domain-containing protein, partial [Paludibacter sp.]